MKKIFGFAAALAVVLAVSCNKDMNPSEGLAQEGKTVKVTMNATAGDPLSKMVLSGKKFAWEVGDELKVRFANVKTYNANLLYDCLTAQASGTGATFTGSLTTVQASKNNMYVFYSTDGAFADSGSSIAASTYAKTVPAQQTGLASDLKSYVVWSSWVTKTAQTYVYNDGATSDVPDALDVDAEMIPNFSVLKFNVPQELGLTSISITADAKIAGELKVNAARVPSSTNDGKRTGHERIVRNSSAEQYETIIVSRGGSVISGDVYVVIAPDAFDDAAEATNTSWELYYNTATKLTFEFTNEDGSAQYEAKLAAPIQMGELKDLGTLPLNIMTPKVEAGALRLTDSVTLTVGVSDSNPNCTYYYEIGASKAECPDPTTASTQFDPSEGFSPVVTGTSDRYFIKVLAHTEEEGYRDVVLTASLRNWRFKDGCPVDEILSKVESGEEIPAVGDSKVTSDGLECYRNSLVDGDKPYYIGTYEANSSRIAFNTARIQVNAAVEAYASDVWVAYYVDRNTAIGFQKDVVEDKNSNGALDDKEDVNGNGVLDTEKYDWPNKRGYRLFYNNSQSTSQYWSLSLPANLDNMIIDDYENRKLAAEKYNICLHLTELLNAQGVSIKAGDKFGLRADGKHIYYGMAMLEVL